MTVKMIIDVSNQDVYVHGEKVKSIEIKKRKMFNEDDPIQPKEPEEEREMLIYNLEGGHRWVHEIDCLIIESDE